jgi:GT2 family glycosyltransferase
MREDIDRADQVGVVVIGRNERARVVDCLKSVPLDRRKVIYVDSGSTDDSVTLINQLGFTVVRLDPVRQFTAGRARNEGFLALKSLNSQIRFVHFIDGDCQFVRGWIAQAVNFLQDRPDIAVVCGRRREQNPDDSVYNQLCDVEWDTPVGEAIACGGDSLVRVEAFEAVGGFRDALIAGEEPDLCARLSARGWRIWRLKADMTIHDVAMRHFRQWWARSVRSGYGFMEVCLLHRRSKAPPFKRNIRSAVFWAGILPIVLLGGTILNPAVALGGLAYPLQICRIAVKMDPRVWRSWAYALFVIIAKIAELQGIAKFWWLRWRGRAARLIEYKAS